MHWWLFLSGWRISPLDLAYRQIACVSCSMTQSSDCSPNESAGQPPLPQARGCLRTSQTQSFATPPALLSETLATPDNLASVIYTSQYGKPRARSSPTATWCVSLGDVPGIASRARCLDCFHSHAFDFSVGIVGACFSGGAWSFGHIWSAAHRRLLPAVTAGAGDDLTYPFRFLPVIPLRIIARKTCLRYVIFGGEALNASPASM